MGLVGALHGFFFDCSASEPDLGTPATFRCRECDNELRIDPGRSLPACLVCKAHSWEPVEAAEEPLVVRRTTKP